MANGDEQDEGKMGRAALVRRVIATEAGAALLAEIVDRHGPVLVRDHPQLREGLHRAGQRQDPHHRVVAGLGVADLQAEPRSQIVRGRDVPGLVGTLDLLAVAQPPVRRGDSDRADGAGGDGQRLSDVRGVRDDGTVVVRPVQCLSVCKRSATVAVTSTDGYTFLFGDLETESGTAALESFVRSYRASDYGLVPWRERAQVLRKGMIARVPPLAWSPDDGRPPS